VIIYIINRDGDKRVENLSKDLSVSTAEMYRCIQFREMFPDILTVREKLINKSWHFVTNQILPKHRKKVYENPPFPEGKIESFNRLKDCGFQWETLRTVG